MARQVIIVGSTPDDTSAESIQSGLMKVNENFAELYGSPSFSDSIVLPKTSGKGIKVDGTAPTFGWKDLIGQLSPAERWQTDTPRTDVPNLSPFRGTYSKDLAFKANDKLDRINFHMPHDYAPGTDLFIHLHWGHNGTAISGQFTIHHYVQYAKGHNQSIFNDEIDIPHTILTPNIAAVPRWMHRLDEIQLSAAGGLGGILDTNLLEPDGLIITAFVAETIPTITGSAALNQPYLFAVDIHYQSTQSATKQKAPDFYT